MSLQQTLSPARSGFARIGTSIRGTGAIATDLTIAIAAAAAILLGIAGWFAGWLVADSKNVMGVIAKWLLGVASFLLTYLGLVVLVWSAAKPITRFLLPVRSELVTNAAITLFAIAMIWLLAIAARRVRGAARAVQSKPHFEDESPRGEG